MEMKQLAEALGIDYSQDPEMDNFGLILQDFVNIGLPLGWVKEGAPAPKDAPKVVYHNIVSNETTDIHPMYLKFRGIFYKELETLE